MENSNPIGWHRFRTDNKGVVHEDKLIKEASFQDGIELDLLLDELEGLISHDLRAVVLRENYNDIFDHIKRNTFEVPTNDKGVPLFINTNMYAKKVEITKLFVNYIASVKAYREFYLKYTKRNHPEYEDEIKAFDRFLYDTSHTYRLFDFLRNYMLHEKYIEIIYKAQKPTLPFSQLFISDEFDPSMGRGSFSEAFSPKQWYLPRPFLVLDEIRDTKFDIPNGIKPLIKYKIEDVYIIHFIAEGQQYVEQFISKIASIVFPQYSRFLSRIFDIASGIDVLDGEVVLVSEKQDKDYQYGSSKLKTTKVPWTRLKVIKDFIESM